MSLKNALFVIICLCAAPVMAQNDPVTDYVVNELDPAGAGTEFWFDCDEGAVGDLVDQLEANDGLTIGDDLDDHEVDGIYYDVLVAVDEGGFRTSADDECVESNDTYDLDMGTTGEAFTLFAIFKFDDLPSDCATANDWTDENAGTGGAPTAQYQATRSSGPILSISDVFWVEFTWLGGKYEYGPNMAYDGPAVHPTECPSGGGSGDDSALKSATNAKLVCTLFIDGAPNIVHTVNGLTAMNTAVQNTMAIEIAHDPTTGQIRFGWYDVEDSITYGASVPVPGGDVADWGDSYIRFGALDDGSGTSGDGGVDEYSSAGIIWDGMGFWPDRIIEPGNGIGGGSCGIGYMLALADHGPQYIIGDVDQDGVLEDGVGGDDTDAFDDLVTAGTLGDYCCQGILDADGDGDVDAVLDLAALEDEEVSGDEPTDCVSDPPSASDDMTANNEDLSCISNLDATKTSGCLPSDCDPLNGSL